MFEKSSGSSPAAEKPPLLTLPGYGEPGTDPCSHGRPFYEGAPLCLAREWIFPDGQPLWFAVATMGQVRREAQVPEAVENADSHGKSISNCADVRTVADQHLSVEHNGRQVILLRVADHPLQRVAKPRYLVRSCEIPLIVTARLEK